LAKTNRDAQKSPAVSPPDVAAPALALRPPTIIKPADGTVFYYANHAGLTITPWDFTFRLGRVVEIDVQTGATVEEGLHVGMSPQHAKAFAKLLVRQLESFEQRYGAITSPRPGEVGEQEETV